MQKKTVMKSKFPQINHKKFYLANKHCVKSVQIRTLVRIFLHSDLIRENVDQKNLHIWKLFTSSHLHLQGLISFKTKKGLRMKRYFWDEKKTLLGIENAAQKSNEHLF